MEKNILTLVVKLAKIIENERNKVFLSFQVSPQMYEFLSALEYADRHGIKKTKINIGEILGLQGPAISRITSRAEEEKIVDVEHISERKNIPSLNTKSKGLLKKLKASDEKLVSIATDSINVDEIKQVVEIVQKMVTNLHKNK